MLDLLPWGRMLAVPDFVALVLVFWNIHQPRRVGIGVAFTDGHPDGRPRGARLGENALAYTLLSYGAIMLHRRVVAFPILLQALQVLPLFLVAQIVVLAVRLVIGAPFPGWPYVPRVGDDRAAVAARDVAAARAAAASARARRDAADLMRMPTADFTTTAHRPGTST